MKKWQKNTDMNAVINERKRIIDNNSELFLGVTTSRNYGSFYLQHDGYDYRISTHSKSFYNNKADNVFWNERHPEVIDIVTNSFKNMVKKLAKIKKMEVVL